METAVAAVEEAILGQSPELKGKSLQIDSRKTIKQNGTRHEIDLYVSVDLGNGYRSNFIFECKNWKASVGKNEIIVFSAKIIATNAQHGFFVARSLTKDAMALVDSDPRITFVPVVEHDAALTPAPFEFHFVIREETDTQITFKQRGKKKGTVSISFEDVSAKLNGEKVNLRELVDGWVKEECDGDLRTFNSVKLADDIYERNFISKRDFAENSLQINDHDVESCEFKIQYNVRVVHPPVVAHYHMENRGRSVTFAPVSVGEGEISVSMAFPENNG